MADGHATVTHVTDKDIKLAILGQTISPSSLSIIYKTFPFLKKKGKKLANPPNNKK